jgi:hypothetical protein
LSDRALPAGRSLSLDRVVAVLTSKRAYVAALAAIVVAATVLGMWNATEYPPYGGYDNERNVEYAKIVYDQHRLPGSGEGASYYKPPAFFAVAGWLISQKDNRDHGRKYVQYFNGVLYAATTALVLLLAALVFPGRRALHLLAGTFFMLLPAVPKMAASFHPAIMSVFFAAAGLSVAAWMLTRNRLGVWQSLGLALVLVAGLLVASQNLWVYGSVLLALLAAGLRQERGSRLRGLVPVAVVLAVTTLLAAPFYVRQTVKYGNPVLALRDGASATPLFDRQPSTFYTAPDAADLFTRPYRPSFNNQLLPTAYAELWGDYFGQWSWALNTPPDARIERELVQQSGVGLLPTLLGIAGWIGLSVALFRQRFRRSELVAIAVLPAASLLGFLYYAISFPSPDGDTIKASYMLVAAPAWALAFAWAADSLRRRPVIGPAVLLVLTGSALLSLPFVTYHDPLWGLL